MCTLNPKKSDSAAPSGARLNTERLRATGCRGIYGTDSSQGKFFMPTVRKWGFLLLFLIACTGDGEYRMFLIDVGYGTSLLFIDPNETAILLDGGYGEEFERLENTLIQAGVDSLALIIASHGHGDHLEGLTLLLNHGWPIGEVAGNVPLDHPTYEKTFWDAVRHTGINYRRLEASNRVKVGKFELEVMHPDTLTHDLNESSLVLLIRLGEFKVLLPADIDTATQRRIGERFREKLKTDILLLPHHGDLLDPLFRERTSPRWALLSVGPNPWELPVEETLTELKRQNIRLLDTRIDGDVIFSFSREDIETVTKAGPNRFKKRELEMKERIRRWTRDP